MRAPSSLLRCPGRPPILLGLRLWLLLWGLLAAGSAQAGEAHRHGAARLNLALEDDHRAVLELLAPAADVVGFEREARTAEEKEQVRERLALLEDEMPRMVVFGRGLGCEFTEKEVTLLGISPTEEGHGHEHDHASDKDEEEDRNQENEHGHGHEADHGAEDEAEHSADRGAEHREVLARFGVQCRRPLAGSTVEIAVGEVFPSLGDLEVVVLSARGQAGHHLHGGKGKVKL